MAKINFPAKTKIAAWWIRVMGWGEIISGTTLVLLFIAVGGGVFPAMFMLIVPIIFLGLILLIVSELILVRERKGWPGAVFILLFLLFLSLGIVPFSGRTLFYDVSIGEWASFSHPVGIIDGLLEKPMPFGISVFFILVIIFYVLPLICLFLDRKNFWTINN